MIAIINYGMGNLRSVYNAFRSVGADALITNNLADIKEAEGIVLPGVGAFADGMKNLQSLGIIDTLAEEVIIKGKLFLGICLGMQLLASVGYEFGKHEGLSWVPGRVDRLKSPEANSSLRLPHMGWNNVKMVKSSRLLQGVDAGATFYFVHSYHFIPESQNVVTGVCDYGVEFAATIEKDNTFATQFHPEKSHHDGLKILENFLGCLSS